MRRINSIELDQLHLLAAKTKKEEYNDQWYLDQASIEQILGSHLKGIQPLKLVLRDSIVSKDGLRSLIGRVKLSHLNVLDLTGINLGSKGIEQLGDALMTLLARHSMKELVLRNANLQGKGTVALAKCISLNKICSLDLSQNFFKNRELFVLFQALIMSMDNQNDNILQSFTLENNKYNINSDSQDALFH